MATKSRKKVSPPPTPTPQSVRFELAAPPGSAVYVAGSFNHWDPNQLPLRGNPNEGTYAVALPVPRGRHEYKFIVNGNWCADPKCAQTAPDGHGALNSVLDV